MISQRYVLDQPSPPSRLRDAFDQHVTPRAIDAAASVEAVLARFSERTRRQPSATLALMFSAGVVLGLWVGKSGRRTLPWLPLHR
jgi:hypothetical protein